MSLEPFAQDLRQENPHVVVIVHQKDLQQIVAHVVLRGLPWVIECSSDIAKLTRVSAVNRGAT